MTDLARRAALAPALVAAALSLWLAERGPSPALWAVVLLSVVGAIVVAMLLVLLLYLLGALGLLILGLFGVRAERRWLLGSLALVAAEPAASTAKMISRSDLSS